MAACVLRCRPFQQRQACGGVPFPPCIYVCRLPTVQQSLKNKSESSENVLRERDVESEESISDLMVCNNDIIWCCNSCLVIIARDAIAQFQVCDIFDAMRARAFM